MFPRRLSMVRSGRTNLVFVLLIASLALWSTTLGCAAAVAADSDELAELRVGRVFPAFDHLGDFSHQAKAAAACGVTMIYASGLGSHGYSGLPAADEWARQCSATASYVREAKALGIHVVVGYLCATSIVDLDKFDANWDDTFRAQFHTRPSEWRQQDRDGRPLPSWYERPYEPACMNNPDWRAYQRFMVRQELEVGCDGVYFDNPTVHPKGCYCPHCMTRFAAFLRDRKIAVGDTSLEGLRKATEAHPQEFVLFRATTARDFFADMRAYARTVNPHALLTANNSLNSPDVLFKQNRAYGYDIYQMSLAEDFVTIEDVLTQPRTLADGRVKEYGPTYEQLQAIVHSKPLIVCTIAQNDYHTPPHLTRLAMAEAAAHGASYLLWPTWPEDVRQKMIDAIRPQVDLLRSHQELLAPVQPRREVVLFLPYRRWVETEKCAVSALAAELSRANVQYEVVCEDNFNTIRLQEAKVLLVESLAVLNAGENEVIEGFRQRGGAVLAADSENWPEQLKTRLGEPAVLVQGPTTVRAVVRDQPERTIVHLLNLNVLRHSSFEDEVHPAENLRLTVRVPFSSGGSVEAITADAGTSSGKLTAAFHKEAQGGTVETVVPRLDVAAILVFAPTDAPRETLPR